MQNKENLYGWLFTYNPYHDLWYACDRDHYLDLFTNRASEGVISSPDFETLKQLVINKLHLDKPLVYTDEELNKRSYKTYWNERINKIPEVTIKPLGVRSYKDVLLDE